MVTLSTLFNSPSTLMRSALLSPQYGGKKRDLVKLWKGASPVAQQWRIHLQCRSYRRCRFDPWVKNIPWRKKWQLTPVFLLQNPMDRGAWHAIVLGVTKSRTHASSGKAHFSDTMKAFFLVKVELAEFSALHIIVTSSQPLCFHIHLWVIWKLPLVFPGSPVTKTLSSQCRRPGFDPWSGN